MSILGEFHTTVEDSVQRLHSDILMEKITCSAIFSAKTMDTATEPIIVNGVSWALLVNESGFRFSIPSKHALYSDIGECSACFSG